LIDHAVRYLPILRLLRAAGGANDTILEIGSGSYGLGEYYSNSFVGCDVTFEEKPKPPMRPVVASASELPFPDSSFDTVIASDVLEHVPANLRLDVLREALRVARKLVLVSFPCGPVAYALDQRLFARYQELGKSVPPWLEEHMQYPFPDERIFQGLGDEWTVQTIGNDNLYFHEWLLRRMMRFRWMFLFRLIERVPRQLMELALRLADRGQCYRRIFAVTRVPGFAPATRRFVRINGSSDCLSEETRARVERLLYDAGGCVCDDTDSQGTKG
jgi:SAM-dependent methyltransferase